MSSKSANIEFQAKRRMHHFNMGHGHVVIVQVEIASFPGFQSIAYLLIWQLDGAT